MKLWNRIRRREPLASPVGKTSESTELATARPEIVAAHVDLIIQNIANTLIIKDAEMIDAPVRFIADWLSYAPSRDDTSRYGLLVQSLNIAQAAAILADGSLFTGLDSSEDRRLNEPKYRYAAMLAGLFSNLPLLASSRVTWDGDRWVSIRESLSRFAQRHGNFGVTWATPSAINRDVALWIIARNLPDIAANYLMEADPAILSAMLSAIAPEKVVSRLQQVVATAVARVTHDAKSDEIVPTTPALDNLPTQTATGGRVPNDTVELKTEPKPNGKPALKTEPESNAAAENDDPLKRIGDAAASVLRAVAEDAAKDPSVATQLRRTVAGLSIPIKVLAVYGVPGGAITAGLQQGGVLRERTRTHLVLSDDIADSLFSEIK